MVIKEMREGVLVEPSEEVMKTLRELRSGSLTPCDASHLSDEELNAQLPAVEIRQRMRESIWQLREKHRAQSLFEPVGAA
jgi:hypothetical protein